MSVTTILTVLCLFSADPAYPKSSHNRITFFDMNTPETIPPPPQTSAQDSVVCFVDRFVVPPDSRDAFITRMQLNRRFIRTLPGFIHDTVYEGRDATGKILILTIAVWKNEACLQQAKAAVQAAYKEEGFDPPAFMERLHITMDRAQYKRLSE